MLVATFTVRDDQPRVLRTVPHPARWLVQLYATDGEERIDRDIRNKQPCHLSELLPTAREAISELLEELPAYTAAGFRVTRLR